MVQKHGKDIYCRAVNSLFIKFFFFSIVIFNILFMIYYLNCFKGYFFNGFPSLNKFRNKI